MKVIVSIFLFSCTTLEVQAKSEATMFRLRGRVPASVNIKAKSKIGKDVKIILNFAKEKYSIKTKQNSKYRILVISFH